MTNRTPVKDMARALHEKIKQYGAKAVWEQIDPRFKASEGKALEGIKTKEKSKITFKSFEKGYERLLREQKTAENMNFGIRGNPLLLSNVFRILGIKSFEDLTTETFPETDPKAKLFTIENKVDSLREQIENLDEKLETHIRRRSRITVLKVAADFDRVTKRLLGILKNNKDCFIDIVASNKYVEYFNTIMKMTNIQEQISNILQLQKHMEQMQKQKKESDCFHSLCQAFFKNISEEEKRVLYFYWIIYEYNEYCFFLHSLRRYYRVMTNKEYLNAFNGYTHSNLYVMSPLYISLFYLIIALQYIKKTGAALDTKLNDITDENIIKKIEQTGIDRSTKGRKITKSKYYELMTARLIKQISRIVKPFNINGRSQQIKVYEKYKEILHKILSLYEKALIDIEKPSEEEIMRYKSGIKIILDLSSMGVIGVCGLFRLNNEIMEEYDILVNDISNLAQETRRDLNV